MPYFSNSDTLASALRDASVSEFEKYGMWGRPEGEGGDAGGSNGGGGGEESR